MKHTSSIRTITLWVIFGSLIGVLLYTKQAMRQKAPQCKNCDVVIISLDTIRASELPCFGYTRNTMPNLCRFADQNIRFSQAYSQSSWTFPNATSVMTGMYPSGHKMYDNILDVLHPTVQSLPKLYKKAGYHTVAIINSQETNIPLPVEIMNQFDTVISTRGFYLDKETQTWTDTFARLSNAQKPLFLYIYTTYVGYYRSTDIGIRNTFPLDPTFTPPPFIFEKTFTNDLRTDAQLLVRELFETATNSATKEQYLNLSKDFSPDATARQASRAFDTLSEGQKLFLYQEKVARKLDPKDPEHLRYIRNLYDANISLLDTHLAPLLDVIGDKKHNQNTLAIVYSDHGENLGDHASWGHAMEPYSTLTHVPLIVHIPNTTPMIQNGLTQIMDIFPTILSLTHIPLPSLLLSKDNRLPLSTPSETENRDSTAISELNYGNDASIRTKQWLLMLHKKDNKTTYKLYNLEIDPKEEHDVSSDYADIVEKLRNLYEQKTLQ